MTETAADRERERLAEVRRRRASRDEARRQEALREADELQRAPLLLTLGALLRHRLRQEGARRRQAAAAEREEVSWAQSGLNSSAVARWRADGWMASEALPALRALDRADERMSQTLWSDRSALDPRRIESCLSEMVAALPPVEAVELLADVAVPPGVQLSPELEDLIVHLAADEPPPLRSYADETVTVWALAKHVRLGRTLRRLGVPASSLPLPLVETLIDRSPRLLLEELSSSEQDATLRRYVLARTQPGELSDSDVAALPWTYEAGRRALVREQQSEALEAVPFLAACARLFAGCGTRADLELVDSEAQTTLTAELLLLGDGGPVTPRMTDDPTCWRQVARILRKQLRSVTQDDDLGRWLVLDQLRRAVLGRRSAEGLALIKQTTQAQRKDSRVAAELQTAAGLLNGFVGDRPRTLKALERAHKASTNDITSRNLELAERVTDPARMSAYVVLGLPHGDPGWSAAADRLHARLWLQDPEDLMTEVNWATDALESSGGDERWLVWPIRPSLYDPVPKSAGVFRPPASPHPPVVEPLDDAGLLALREQAASAVTQHVLRTIDYERAS